MSAIGWILTIIGAFVSIGGMVSRNDAISDNYGYGRYYNRGEIEDAQMVMVIGAVILVIGILVLLASYLKKRDSAPKESNGFATKKCLRCGNIVDVNTAFCPNCGNNLINQYNGNNLR